MIITTHQPIFLPWPGFFHKARRSDCMVLLDDVQFPRGGSWMTRNRLKYEQGTLWLTVPVWRRDRGLQSIRSVEICDERSWRRKHLQSIRQAYTNAPHFDEFFGAIGSIYEKKHERLADFNIDLIRLFWKVLALDTRLLLQSELGIEGRGTDLLLKICSRLGADRLSIFPATEKHIDTEKLSEQGISLVKVRFNPPVYPQLWGDFMYNLSMLDMLLNCGPASKGIVGGDR
jgi:hypothetical protein